MFLAWCAAGELRTAGEGHPVSIKPGDERVELMRSVGGDVADMVAADENLNGIAVRWVGGFDDQLGCDELDRPEAIVHAGDQAQSVLSVSSPTTA